MKNQIKNKKLSENRQEKIELPVDYENANIQFQQMIKRFPDFLKMEPIEIYKWIEKLAKLTKI